MWPRACGYVENRIGPRIHPWGAPSQSNEMTKYIICNCPQNKTYKPFYHLTVPSVAKKFSDQTPMW